MMKLRWGDADDDEEMLPEGTTTGPNDKGILTKTEYFHNGKGEAVKKTTKIQLVNVKTRVYEVRQPLLPFVVTPGVRLSAAQCARRGSASCCVRAHRRCAVAPMFRGAVTPCALAAARRCPLRRTALHPLAGYK